MENRTTAIELAEQVQTAKELMEYLIFAQQHPQLSPDGCAQAYTARPDALHLDTAESYFKQGILVLPEQQENGIELGHSEVAQYFIKNNETVFLGDATPADLQAIDKGELRLRTTPAEAFYTVYDITQTNCPKERYPQVIANRSFYLGELEQYQLVTELSEKCGILVDEKEMHSAMLGYFDEKANTVYINSQAACSQKLDALLDGYALGLVETTSTQAPAVKDLERYSLYVSMCEHTGTPVAEPVTEQLGTALKHCQNDPYFRLEDSLNRVQRMSRMVFEHLDREPMGGQQAQQRPVSMEAAQAVAENFMKDL